MKEGITKPIIHKERATGREYISAPEPGMPVLRGQVKGRSRNVIRVYCPYCNCTHTHGWDRDRPAMRIERREAHCDGNSASPFREIGYYIGVLRATDE